MCALRSVQVSESGSLPRLQHSIWDVGFRGVARGRAWEHKSTTHKGGRGNGGEGNWLELDGPTGASAHCRHAQCLGAKFLQHPVSFSLPPVTSKWSPTGTRAMFEVHAFYGRLDDFLRTSFSLHAMRCSRVLEEHQDGVLGRVTGLRGCAGLT